MRETQQYRETDAALIVAAQDGNIDLPEEVVAELVTVAERHPEQVQDNPDQLLSLAQRRLFARGKREDAAELVAKVKALRGQA